MPRIQLHSDGYSELARAAVLPLWPSRLRQLAVLAALSFLPTACLSPISIEDEKDGGSEEPSTNDPDQTDAGSTDETDSPDVDGTDSTDSDTDVDGTDSTDSASTDSASTDSASTDSASTDSASTDGESTDGELTDDTDGGDDGPDAGAEEAGCVGCMCRADFSCDNAMICSVQDQCVGAEWAPEKPQADFHPDRALIWDQGQWL